MKKKATGKISPLHLQFRILGRLETSLPSNERDGDSIYFGWSRLFKNKKTKKTKRKKPRIKIGGTGRHACLIEGKYAGC